MVKPFESSKPSADRPTSSPEEEVVNDWGLNVYIPPASKMLESSNSSKKGTANPDEDRKFRCASSNLLESRILRFELSEKKRKKVILDLLRRLFCSRLFRSACLAVTASLVRPDDHLHVDIEAMYRTVQKDRIGVERWNAFITETIKEAKRKRKDQVDKAAKITAKLALM